MNAMMKDKLAPFMMNTGFYNETAIAQQFDNATEHAARFMDIFGDDGSDDLNHSPSEELAAAREYNCQREDEILAVTEQEALEILTANPINYERAHEIGMAVREVDLGEDFGAVQVSYNLNARARDLLRRSGN